jgi:hypothetical protein
MLESSSKQAQSARLPAPKNSLIRRIIASGTLSGLMVAQVAMAQTPRLPSGANTTNLAAPFYIDLSGLDFKTSLPTRDSPTKHARATH